MGPGISQQKPTVKGMDHIDNGVFCRNPWGGDKVVCTVNNTVSNEKGAPKAAERVLMEVFDITTCLAQLQEYLLVPRAGFRSRKALIMVREVQVTLANTVIIFFELEHDVDSMKLDRPMGTANRIKWTLKEN